MQENNLSLLGGLTAALEYLELSGYVCMFVKGAGSSRCIRGVLDMHSCNDVNILLRKYTIVLYYYAVNAHLVVSTKKFARLMQYIRTCTHKHAHTHIRTHTHT